MNEAAACPVGALCVSCRGTDGLRAKVFSGPSDTSSICLTLCARCSVGWIPLRWTGDAHAYLIAEHRKHLGLPPRPDSVALYTPKAMSLPAVLDDPVLAVEYLHDYFLGVRRADGGPLFTGGRFERLGVAVIAPKPAT